MLGLLKNDRCLECCLYVNLKLVESSVQLLIAEGANLDKKNAFNQTAVYLAAALNNPLVVADLISSGMLHCSKSITSHLKIHLFET